MCVGFRVWTLVASSTAFSGVSVPVSVGGCSERYGAYTTCYNWFIRWRFVRRKRGVWNRILDDVSKGYEGDIVMIDGSCVRVHQHGATARKDDDDGGMGRSRGGLTAKYMLLWRRKVAP